MNDRQTMRRAVTASVIAVCGLVLSASLLVVAGVDRARVHRAATPSSATDSQLLAAAAPALGLRRAPAVARRRVVVVRRTRAS